MGKNVKGGKKHKRGKNKGAGDEIRPIIYKDKFQDYALVTKLLGNSKDDNFLINKFRVAFDLTKRLGLTLQEIWYSISSI